MYFAKGSLHKKYGMEHLISFDIKFDDKNRKNRVTCKTFVATGRKTKVPEPNYGKPNNHWQNAECFKHMEGQSG